MVNMWKENTGLLKLSVAQVGNNLSRQKKVIVLTQEPINIKLKQLRTERLPPYGQYVILILPVYVREVCVKQSLPNLWT